MKMIQIEIELKNIVIEWIQLSDEMIKIDKVQDEFRLKNIQMKRIFSLFQLRFDLFVNWNESIDDLSKILHMNNSLTFSKVENIKSDCWGVNYSSPIKIYSKTLINCEFVCLLNI